MIALANFNDVFGRAYLLGQKKKKKTCLLENPPDLPFLTTCPIMMTEAGLRVAGAVCLEMIKRSVNASPTRAEWQVDQVTQTGILQRTSRVFGNHVENPQ